MSKLAKGNLIIGLITSIFSVIGFILMFSGINSDNMGIMFAGIGMVVLSFMIGMGIIAFRSLKVANERHRKELDRFYDNMNRK